MQARCPITTVKPKDGEQNLRTLGGRLAWARAQRKLTQADLAAKAGVKQSTIGNLESGARKNPRELLALCAALYCNPDWLVTGKGEWDVAKTRTSHVAEKGAVYHVPSADERGMLEVWRRMSPSDRKLMLAQMAEKAERYQLDMQQSLDEAGVHLPFPLTSPVKSSAAARAVLAKTSVTPSRQKDLPLEEHPKR